MKMQKSAGFIIYKKEKDKVLYLLLKHPAKEDEDGWWSFPKGTMEKEETPLETAKRELSEETGILKEEIKIKDDFNKSIKYFFTIENQKIFKIVVFFLAETKKESIKLSLEHNDFGWMDFKSAITNLKYEELKNALEEADKFISSLQ